MKTYSLILVYFLFVGCTNKTKPNEFIQIGINLKLLDSDVIKLYYVINEQDTYTEENVEIFNIKGSTDFQHITFRFRQAPKKFRIDLGENSFENEIHFSSIIISKDKDSIVISNRTMHRFFRPNIYAIPINNGFKRIKVKNRYDPFLESTALLRKKIELELL